MVDPKKNQGRKRPVKNTYTTKSGTAIKLNRSLTERIKARRDAKSRRRAAYLSTLPKNRFKRILYRLHPKRVYRYWFSRQGGIMALKLVGVGIVIFFVFIVGVFAYFRKDLPDINDLSGSKLGGSVSYYDRTSQTLLWQDYNAVKRLPIPGNQIPNVMREASVAIEDKSFYQHGAFDVKGIVRAGFHDLFSSGGGLQGGSTITQQLVKLNENWTDDQTISRKIKEVILATELEREYSKADILNGYLNIAPYGPVEYGVQTAAQDYFGENAQNLTLPQAAMLAAIPKSPSTYSPYGPGFSASALISRQRYILQQMVDQKMISQAEATAAAKVDVLSQVQAEPSSLYNNIQAPYFVQAAKEQLDTMYGTSAVNRGGWTVTTTVDMTLQHLAEKEVTADMPEIHSQGGDNAAFVAEQVNTGEIVALVGGYDFNDPTFGQINYATDVNISPGSSFKPYDYSTFVENNNAGAGSVIYDNQGALPGYPCTDKTQPLVDNPSDPDGSQKCLWDYDFLYPGPITLRYAIGGSRNVPAVKLMLSAIPNDSSPGHTASINKTIATAEAMMGNTTNGYECYTPQTNIGPGADPSKLKAGETQCYGSAAIGDGAYLRLDDHVNGFATLARLGKEIPRTFILKITDANNKSIYQYQVPSGKQVIHQDTAYIVDDMTSDPNASYLPGRCTTGSSATCSPLSSFGYKFQRYNGWNFSVKTGTTNSGFDGLMASWSTQYAAVVWVGNHTRTVSMHGPGMEYMTEPIVRGWMQGATDNLNMKPVNWQQPSDIQTKPAYIITKKVSKLGEIIPSKDKDIYPSWYSQKSGGDGSQTIDVVSNLVATSCTPTLAQKTQGNANVNQFSVDIFFGTTSSASSSSSSTDPDNVHNCNDTKPSITVTQGACEEANKCDFTVAVTQGTHPLSGGSYTTTPASSISLIVNNQTVQTISIPADSGSQASYNYTFTGVSVSDGQSVQGQVVDSVLYSGSDTITAQNTGGPTNSPNGHQ